MRVLVRIFITCLAVYCPQYVFSQDTIKQYHPVVKGTKADSISPERENIYPYTSLQQLLKGNTAGVYIQEPTGESGAFTSIALRGTAIPSITSKDIYESQPTIVLDGIPLIMDHPFTFDIQLFGYNHLGPASNLLSAIDLNNIEKIEVVKDFGRAAMYGPRAANGGVILLTTKAPVKGRRKISFNTYFGMVQRPHIYTTNAKFENDFRQRFYNKYATTEQLQTYPLYLRDSTNNAYYGPSNWTDLYFKNTPVYGVNASLSSGTDRANFRFAAGNQRSANTADNSKMDRYNAMFEINMVPLQGFTVSSMISASRLERTRSRWLRDRFAEMQYLPDLSSPLPPNKQYYAQYLDQFTKSFDDNKTNEINGYFKINIKPSNSLQINSQFGFDYNEGLRDLFYPSTLLETVNYLSNYFGYNQRVIFNNSITFDHTWKEKHHVTIEAGEGFQADYHRYNYAYAYKGPNDLIRINLLHSDNTKDEYLSPKSFDHALIFSFLDKQRARLLSFYGRAAYDYNDQLDLSVLFRADGSSSAQPDNWWLFTPTFTAGLNIKNIWLKDNHAVDALKLQASWGRVGRLMPDDRFGEGPQYTSDLSFSNNPVRFSYNGFPGISRAYSSGYIGYGITWPYTDQLNVNVSAGVLDNKLQVSLDLYNKTDHNMLLAVPFSAEYGYNFRYRNGMAVRNRGIDLSLKASVLPAKSAVQWVPGITLNYNRNTLIALPDGMQELTVANGSKLLKVGNAIDQYWVLENEGIYNRDADIPTSKEGKRLNYKGIPLMAGDPRWKDINGDNVIDDKDKVLKGHVSPVISGGFNNDIYWKGFTLGLSFYCALGRKVMNAEVANRFDFINREGKIDMSAVKEITFWSKVGNYDKYPLYNPWSTVDAYRTDQDLFLENGSFLKLRTLSLQYDMTTAKWWNKKGKINGLAIYATATNVFTITPYTGGDPELVDFNGFDTGYSLPLSRTYTIGLKMDL
ncbi:SusC/RagA family TonB-linked outer membrane protein [Chitinophaga ginsengisoli]|uniref:TonB-linked SusC/RagA family outer membrane protein n=1 Tax=Chitinophaga ginsengisoli TaxID=363837 RepID=A0A2P8G7C1_9BACT|nr:SusC/RagA family TonB-linked outer membrane protein [Chitinophaga ginsengisoli]PSL29775.1 TonB-linked SusC/RagA family outer membrane protein [Chitinophaga ginsengisoli]